MWSRGGENENGLRESCGGGGELHASYRRVTPGAKHMRAPGGGFGELRFFAALPYRPPLLICFSKSDDVCFSKSEVSLTGPVKGFRTSVFRTSVWFSWLRAGRQEGSRFGVMFCSAQNVQLWLPASTAIVLPALRKALHTFFDLWRAVSALFQETSFFSGDGRINLYKRI